MRFFTFLLCLLPMAGIAETFVVPSKVTDVTLYPESAKITKKAAFSIPAGTHYIVVNNILVDREALMSIRVNAEDLRIGQIVFRENIASTSKQSGSDDVQAALSNIKGIELQIATVENDARQARLAAIAAQTQIGFLDQLGSNEGTPLLDPDNVRALSQVIGTEALNARQVALTAEIAAQKIELVLPDLNEALKNAQKSLDILQPTGLEAASVSIEVFSEKASDGDLSLTYNMFGLGTWTPAYDIYLDRENPDHVDIQRDALVLQQSGENWTSVNLTLSTLEPDGQIDPVLPFSRRHRLVDVDPQNMGNLAEPMVEAPVIVEDTGSAFYMVDDSGLGTVYKVANPISIASDNEIARIPLGRLRIPARLSALAVPSRDDTAFLMANVTNDSGEDLLASEFASFFVDGAFVGTNGIERITSNDTREIGFGPINGLRLKSIRLLGGEGESGIISRYNERRNHQRYGIENLTDEAWDVRMLSSVPHSSHDDLIIKWNTSLPPDEVDVDDRIGVLGWDLTLPPGAVQSVYVETSMTWPSDKELR
jgi:Domain of unknown function (DUF4139)/N-terminal domain of unknown function (DUF4140)